MSPPDDNDSDDLDADSVLRALAAAPAVKPPPRVVTVMVIRLGDAAPREDQIASVRALVEPQQAKVENRDDGTVGVVWSDPLLAAAAALELRDALPETRIAMATEAGGPAAMARVLERAAAILAQGSERICVDDATADLIEKKFELERGEGGTGARFVLVEPMASGTPALVDKVIGNYKIVRLLGTGGMGVVYVAEHVSLGRKAVIKFVQDRLTTDAAYMQRFFIEAKTAASIRHPGIVDVFDYGKDDRGRGYIVMELLEGESLRTRLRREKPLKLELAIALGAQMANALAAAHAAGVIHRDLKPDNLFLVPDNDSPYKLRAKVLDFGLAKIADDQSPGLTQSGNFVGTPLYMSPEQCRAKADIDHRTDIYSLGCIVYEMVTGRPPFLDKTVGDLIIAHNTMPPTPPSVVVPSISSALERTILKALAKHPDERFATMEAFAAALTAQLPSAPVSVAGEATPLARPRGFSSPPPLTHDAQRASAVSAVSTAPAGSRRKRIAIGGAALVAIFAAGIGAVVLRGHETTARPRSRAANGRPTIAVLALENKSGAKETAWLATALGEVITTELQTGKQLDVMPAADVARMKADLGVGDDAEWSADRLQHVRSDLGVDYVVVGSYLAVAGQIQVDAKLYDTAAGTARAQLSEKGQESDLIGLGSRVSITARRELGLALDDEAPPPVTALPANAAAAKLYSEGLGKLRRFDLVEARDLFTKAAAEAPDDALVHSALASVWQALGYSGKVRSEAKLAYDNASSLPRENKLVIEAQYRESNAQWDQAIEAYKTLFEFFPTRLEYGLALAAVQTHAGDAKSAYATLDKLRKLPHPLGSDPRIELAEAKAAEEADDTARMLVHAEHAATLANKRGARLLRANALLKQGWALFTLGREQEASPIYAEAKQLFTDLGDRSGLARTLNNIALVEHRHHRDTDATKTFAEALKIANEIGDTEAQAWVLNNWGYVLADAGELDQALELDMKKLELGGERGDPPSSQAAAHVNISEVLRWRGDLAGARSHCNASEDLLRGLDARRFAAYSAMHCGEVMRAEDDLGGARKRFEQAIGWASDVLTPAESAEMRLAMARDELDEGRPQEAETLARAALADLTAANEGSQRVCAVAVLANALLVRGQTADAAKEIAATSTLPSEGVSFACRIPAEIAGARVMAASDPAKKVDALARLDDTRRRAAAATFVQQEMEARLAIGELQGAAGREGLRRLAKDAGALGFSLVARKAKTLAR